MVVGHNQVASLGSPSRVNSVGFGGGVVLTVLLLHPGQGTSLTVAAACRSAGEDGPLLIAGSQGRLAADASVFSTQLALACKRMQAPAKSRPPQKGSYWQAPALESGHRCSIIAGAKLG